MNKPLWSIIVAVVIIVGLGIFYKVHKSEIQNPSENIPIFPQAGLKLGEARVINGLTLTPLEVVEDSRCSTGVQCIWAGTVKVRTNIAEGNGNSTEILELGKAFTVATQAVTLTSVTPTPQAGQAITPSDYRFEFIVTSPVQTSNPGTGGCYVGGCSAQLCSDTPNAISTCEYTAAYACYQTARCERQSTGQCGWTQTPALTMCLNKTDNP